MKLHKSFSVILFLLCNVAVLHSLQNNNRHPKRNLNWRIIGGYDAPEGLYPYQASIREQDSSSRTANQSHCQQNLAERGNFHFGFHTCGASIISAEYVLTAAHCVQFKYPEMYLVVVGTNRLDEGGDAYAVTEIHWNQQFSIFSGQHDVAILKVSPPIIYTDKVTPVLIEEAAVHPSEQVILTGWGDLDRVSTIPNSLQHVNLLLVDVTYCNELHQFSVTDNQVCTSTDLGYGACKGDSGGPLVKLHSNVLKQVGIVSFSRDCAQGYPDVYTKVASYLPWIREKCNNCV